MRTLHKAQGNCRTASADSLRSSSRARIGDVGVSDLTQLPIALVAFVCMTGAAVAGFFAATAGKERPHREVHATIRLIADILVVMTTLALSLMLNSAKNTFEEDNRNIHALATDLILLDRTLKALGSPADEARRQIADYVRISLREANIVEEDPEAEAALDAAGASLRAIRVSDDVVDLSEVKSSDYLGHSKFADALPELQNIAAGGAGRRRGLRGAGLFVLNTTGRILSAPAAIGDALQR